MRLFFALLAGKLLRFTCRVLNRGGTAAPGKIAMKLCPDLLEKLSSDVNCYLISGTNGKTTAVRMVAVGFQLEGLPFFANFSGANLIEGIATEFIVNSDLTGQCRKKYAVLETDEFTMREVCGKLQPKAIMVTNLFVDQVERFGGVKGSLDGIISGVRKVPNATLILNADDSVSASLAKDVPNSVIWFGIGEEAAKGHPYSGYNDVKECVRCGAELEYRYMTFSHLGAFRCPKCGHSQQRADYLIEKIEAEDLEHSELKISAEGKNVDVRVNLPEMYNMYNAAGALALMIEAVIGTEAALSALAKFRCGFGRMEVLPQLGNRGARMVLVKNGAGCDQVIEYLKKYDEDFVLSIYLNNNVSDGTDISWLQDVAFERLNECRVKKIYVSGICAADMRERLLKARIPEDIITVEKKCKILVEMLRVCEEPIFILPTYTGMMAIRGEIIRQCGGSDFWDQAE